MNAILVIAAAVAFVVFVVWVLETIRGIKMNIQELNQRADEIQAGVDAMEAEIKRLKEVVAGGGVVSQEDLDALGAKLGAIKGDIDDTSDQQPVDPTQPPPEVPETAALRREREKQRKANA